MHLGHHVGSKDSTKRIIITISLQFSRQVLSLSTVVVYHQGRIRFCTLILDFDEN